jgi:DNA-binding MarR family transcriptional regulator
MGSQESVGRGEVGGAPPPRPAGELDPEIVALADRLHSTAIHLLRRVRGEDTAMGLTPPRASALSVIVFGGPITLGELAVAEQVRPPTVSRLVRDLEEAGLVVVRSDPRDGRVRVADATAEGRALLTEGRARRVAHLARALAALTVAQRRTLVRAAGILEKVVIPEGRPGPGS